MKLTLLAVIGALAISSGALAVAEQIDTHKAYLPKDLNWGAAPAALPAGAEAVVLYGDPQKPAMFAMRVKMPVGYRVPPHMHPQPELITVISGAVGLGLGQAADHATVEALPAGSFSSMPKGVAHYVLVTEDAVIQINATGPWDIEYVNPKDDPRLNVAPQVPKRP